MTPPTGLINEAALSLRESYMLKAPNSKLSGKDKAAIVAKELGDFLGHYKRDTELFTVFREESGMILRHIFEPNKVNVCETNFKYPYRDSRLAASLTYIIIIKVVRSPRTQKKILERSRIGHDITL